VLATAAAQHVAWRREGMRAVLVRSARGANNADTLGKPTRLTG
jgi:hypothetical protein